MRLPSVMLVLGVLICASCGPSKPSEPDPVELIGASAETLRYEVAELRSEIEALRSAVAQFDEENWREVVPQVEDATSALEGRLNTLESASDAVVAMATEITDRYEQAQEEMRAEGRERP